MPTTLGQTAYAYARLTQLKPMIYLVEFGHLFWVSWISGIQASGVRLVWRLRKTNMHAANNAL